MEELRPPSKEKLQGEAYRLFSACFCLPRREWFLQEGLFKNLATVLSEICNEAVPFVSEMERSLLETSEEELRVEYARLFVGPYELKAPPYGSVYLDGERRLMGDSTLEVLRQYEEAGLVLEEGLKEPPDHIAIELEFMYYLLYKEAEAREDSEREKANAFRETRERFFKKLLNPWVPIFCEKIKESTDHPFYVALSNCLTTFVSRVDI
ncbi:MAG: molecular chaperone TorD family protein [Desulfobacterota bacterium]|nr:molecular chaperone TorD family protein [Thermodesulfobacteriota bacterium]